MSGNQFVTQLNWQSATPIPFVPQAALSGVVHGVMSGTSVIYSNIIRAGVNEDSNGLELTWTGTPTGVIEVMASVSGTVFYPITFTPALTQPAGSASGFLIDCSAFPYKYLMVKYTNTSGTGTLSVWLNSKE